MSIDLKWPPEPDTLASTLLTHLNTHLSSSSSSRPSFIGPIEITSLDFGDTPPDVELIDMRDIYRDFTEDSDSSSSHSSADGRKETRKDGVDEDEDEDFEWVSRRVPTAHEDGTRSFAYEHLPPHVRMGVGALSSSIDVWTPGGTMGMGMMDFARPAYAGMYRPFDRTPSPPPERSRGSPEPKKPKTPSSLASPDPKPDYGEPGGGDSGQPNIQLHLLTHWSSNLRLTLTTSLLINYPSPSFMSLPIKLSVTGLVFQAEVVVAYEGEPSSQKRGTGGRRVHICIMDDMDPYAPAAAPKKSVSGLGLGNERREEDEEDDDHPLDPDSSGEGLFVPPTSPKPSSTKTPVGQRILPNIVIESEIGDADRHVLKNVTRVERFIQDAIRKTVEEELVWPNFWTGVLG